MMSRVFGLRKVLALAVAPTVTPSRMVMMFISSFCAVLDRRSTTPLSRKRLPSMSMPISGAALGRSRTQIAVTKMGNRIFSVFETGRSCSITTERSFFVVSARMIGGWMIGTSAM